MWVTGTIAIALITNGCAFETSGSGEVIELDVSVRILEPSAADVDCAERSHKIAWIFHRCTFCEFGNTLEATFAEEGIRDASGGICIYNAQPRIKHFQFFDQQWQVVATDEEGWAAQCAPPFIEETLDGQGNLLDAKVVGDMVFEHGTSGCIVEAPGA